MPIVSPPYPSIASMCSLVSWLHRPAPTRLHTLDSLPCTLSSNSTLHAYAYAAASCVVMFHMLQNFTALYAIHTCSCDAEPHNMLRWDLCVCHAFHVAVCLTTSLPAGVSMLQHHPPVKSQKVCWPMRIWMKRQSFIKHWVRRFYSDGHCCFSTKSALALLVHFLLLRLLILVAPVVEG